MKISYKWLQRYLQTDLSVEEIGELLTEIGLETEKIHQIGGIPGGLKGVLVGHVVSCEQHPNADRLKLTQVDVGAEELLSIVCGAPNVAKGQSVLVATVGSTLHPLNGEPFNIKKSKIRGEVSMGMICAMDELGLGSDHDGIIVLDNHPKPGTPASEVVQSDEDFCIEIGLTPNRADAMSHYGVARDLHAALTYRGKSSSLDLPSVHSFVDSPSEKKIQLRVEDEEACPHYLGLLLDNIQVGESPEWLKKALEAIDLKPINNVVDVTNFVLHEVGHPLHAFDYAAIEGQEVVVRTVDQGSKFVTLDEKERELDSADLMICNANGPMCIGGVFGGLNSGVNAETKTIFLESAYFHPVRIRKTAKRHGLNTDASFRYERGVDPNMSMYALKRAALLLQEVAGANVASLVLESGHGKFESHTLDVSIRAMQRLIGQEIPKETILKILVALEIRVIGDTGDKLLLEVPPYRVDVKEQADIVEEVLRIYGLDNIELPDQMLLRADTDELQPLQIVKRRVSEALVAFGFQETLHNSLHKSDWYEKDDIVDILNPLSQDLDIMRNSAMPAGLETISRNLKHRVGDVKIFEFGKTYHKRDARYFERQFLSFWISGKDRPENWQQSTREADIFTLKEGLYRVFRLLGLEVTEKVKDDQLLFKSGKKNLGFMQTVSRKWLKNFDIDQAVFYAELDWDAILQLKDNKKEKLRDVPRFPSVRRDLALLVDKDQVFEKIKRSTINVNPQWIQEVGLFDVYEGKGLPEGKISYAIKVLIQSDEKTLTDAEVDKLMDKVLKVLEKETGAVLRQ
jgi:phenylalanyl-tRNA synthetase beta chain